MKEPLEMNTETWPKRATLSRWGRILNVSLPTLTKYRKQGKLPNEPRQKVAGNALSISKETINKAFNIKPTTK
jgi:hypothetical protein